MNNIPFGEILRTNEQIERYHFRIEYSPSLIYEGTVDRRSESAHVLLGADAEHFPQVETYWEHETGVGRRLGTETWLRLRSRPLPDYLNMAVVAVAEARPVEVRELEGDWLIDFRLDHIPIRDNPIGYLTHLFGEPRDEHGRRFFEYAVQLASQVDGEITMRISREQLLIREISSHVEAGEVRAGMALRFEPIAEELPPPPRIAVSETPSIAPETLMLQLERLAGWHDLKAHCPWAQRTIELIADKDKQAGKYREIYHSSWQKEAFTETVARDPKTSKPNETKHHPIVLGAYYEDETGQYPNFYKTWLNNDAQILANPSFGTDGYMRDYHHFGGSGSGLEYEWYFVFRGYPPTTVGDAYYSARDWGYGINNALNRLSFQEAIRQYNRQTWEGRRAAYLILGHVIHLLQDVGQPDHACLVAHPGSGMDQVEAYKRYAYCHLVAAEAAIAACAACWGIACPICGPAAFGIAEAACWASADSKVMGYEKLIGERFQLSQINTQIKAAGVIKKDSYKEFFQELSSFAVAEADKRNLSSALGCTWLKLVPPVPNADPDIESDDMSETAPYINLTNALVPKIIAMSAGLIEHFYEIANPPPYVQRVVVVKGASGLTPTGFAEFDPKLQGNSCSKVQVCYDAAWNENGLARTKQVTVNRALSPAHNAYVFIQFGPCVAPFGSKTMSASVLGLKCTASSGISVNVALKTATDSQIGTYCWGAFQPTNATAQSYTLKLEISGEDASAHFGKRAVPGAILDSGPATVAYADHNQTPLHLLKNYQPGSDKHHSITIGPAIHADALEVNNSFAQATVVNLGISNAAWPGSATDPGDVIHKNLTLNSQADIDYFAVEFQIGEHDAGGGGHHLFDIGAGLYGEFCSAELKVEIEELYGACPLASIYFSNKTPCKQYANKASFTLDAPVGTFADRKFFLVVKNPDFAKQGPLVYDLKMRYTPSYIAIRGRLLYEFWKVIRPGPIPPIEWKFGIAVGDPPEALMYRDFRRFVKDVETFIPRQLDELRVPGHARLQEMAQFRVALAEVTHRTRMFGDAERLYQMGANDFHEAGMIQEQVFALQRLQAFYGEQGRDADCERISRELAQFTV